MSQTHTNPAGQFVPPNLAKLNTPQWLYNEVMRNIEPDLLTDHLPYLDQWYGGETLLQRMQRIASYERAFEIFEEVYPGIEEMYRKEVRGVKNAAHKQAMQLESTERTGEISGAESALSSLAV